MRIAVTGAAGRIGSAVVRELLGAGHAVVALDVRAGEDSPVAIRETDLSDPAVLREAFAGAGAVCHLANYPGFSRRAPSEGYQNNVMATYRVLEAAEACGVGVVAGASSIQVYGFCGVPEEHVIVGPDYVPVDEAHPLQASHPYAMSKLAGEQLMDAFSRRRREATFYSLRMTAVSDAQRPDGILCGSLFTYVRTEDAARAFRLCCEQARPGHHAMNIVAARGIRPWSMEDFDRMKWNRPAVRGALDAGAALITPARAKAMIGWEAALGCELVSYAEWVESCEKRARARRPA